MPEPPALISQLSFKFSAIFSFTVAAVFINCRDQVIGIIFIIINLCCFKPNIINTDFLGQPFYIFYLVFIMLYHQKLKNNKWYFAFQFLFPFYNILCSFYHLLQFTANAILLISFLCCPIYGNDQSIKTAFNGSFRISIRQVMCIGGS